MGQPTPSYYPPRARWYARIFYLGLRTRHQLALDRIRMPKGITFWGLIAGRLVPGLAVYLRGPRLWGRLAMAACAWLFLVFVVMLGFPLGNYAFGLIVSIHASGLAYYCTPLTREMSLPGRLLFTLALLMGLGLAFYAPARSILQNHCLQPVRFGSHAVVIDRMASSGHVRRGDVIAYALGGYRLSNHGAVDVMDSGTTLGTVLALPGDRVEFSADGVSVNGELQKPLPHMPRTGAVTVPEKHWFIWPNLAISGNGNWRVPEDTISSTMLQMATVSETDFAGRPFKRWFWRTQTLP
jgi:hypothetical protein